MNTLSKETAINLIRDHKGAEMMTIITETVPEMNKTGNPFFGLVKKVCEQNVVVGFDYEKSVNRQLTREEKEAEFFASPRKWGVRKDLKTVEHKGETYLTINPQRVLSVQYFANGKEIDKAELSPWLKEKQPSKLQGTDKEIVYRDVNFSNVKIIKMRGETYRIM